MAQNPPSILEAVMLQLSDLTDERVRLVARVSEIDAALAKVAKQLGLDAADFETDGAPELPRLSKVTAPDTSTIGGAMVQILLNADKGLTRSETRAELIKTPKFAAQIDKNVNSFYNTVGRYLKKGSVVEIDGHLYHPDRAPLPDGEDDPTGQHLSSNIASLFGPHREGNGNG